MLEIPDTIHNIVALLVAAFFLAIGWGIGSWLWGLLPLWGRVVAACVLCVLCVLLLLGRV